MAKCCICNTEIDDDISFFLFQSKDGGSEKCCCESCKKVIEELTDSKPGAAESGTIRLVAALRDNNADPEVREYLTQVIDNNEDKVQTVKPFENSGTTSWTAGLRIFAWIQFFVIIILACCIAFGSRYMSGGTKFVIILAGGVLAFLSVAVEMVFLTMAEDIKAIRNKLDKK